MPIVTVKGNQKEYAQGTSYEKIAMDFQGEYKDTIALAIVNGKITELMKTLEGDCQVSFITLGESAGHKSYVRTAIMLMIKSLYDITDRDGIEKIKVEFAIGPGYYCSLHGKLKADQALTDRLNERMTELVNANIPISKKTYPLEEALKLFASFGMDDKIKLFKYRRSSTVNVYSMDGYSDYYYGYMLPSTRYVRHFKVIPYGSGLMLILPELKSPEALAEFVPQTKLFNELETSSKWGEMMDVGTVGDLNDKITSGHINDLILVQEALQERRIGEIAKDIVSRKGVKFVMIAGPSSSGKTTFSHRLSIQLMSYGMRPHPIAVDDYFVNREDTPRDEKGNYDFESLKAIDTKQFNEDMNRLLSGERVEIPSFNFKIGRREYKGNFKQLGKDDILVIEGIHGLNDEMSYSLPKESKYKIYISALTTLNVDEHNRITTTDGRLLRRMVRDARTRGTSAKGTIQMWDSVRRGEESNIFPFQESADSTFNSALIYELAMLKQFAEPLLFSIGKEEPEYYEAKRLLKFLEYFLGVSSEDAPKNSIIREFVGGSVFNV